MKLIIQRNQAAKTGLLGGHKGMRFSLYARVEISRDEQALIDKYKVNEHVLTYTSTEQGEIPHLRIQNLVKGHTQEIDDVGTLLNNEKVIESACQDFKNLLLVMSSFGGEKVIEI